jgi:predicted N-acetyltransferase YhbS
MLRLKDEQDPIKMQVMQQRFLALRLAEKDILKRHGTVVYEAKKHKA